MQASRANCYELPTRDTDSRAYRLIKQLYKEQGDGHTGLRHQRRCFADGWRWVLAQTATAAHEIRLRLLRSSDPDNRSDRR